jgi:hypothetical protein
MFGGRCLDLFSLPVTAFSLVVRLSCSDRSTYLPSQSVLPRDAVLANESISIIARIATFITVIQSACEPMSKTINTCPISNPKQSYYYFFPSKVFQAAASASATFEPAALAHPLTALQTFPAV